MFKGDKVWITQNGKRTPAKFDSIQKSGKHKVSIEYEDEGKVSTIYLAFTPSMVTKRE